jgi:hypothetical protein
VPAPKSKPDVCRWLTEAHGIELGPNGIPLVEHLDLAMNRAAFITSGRGVWLVQIARHERKSIVYDFQAQALIGGEAEADTKAREEARLAHVAFAKMLSGVDFPRAAEAALVAFASTLTLETQLSHRAIAYLAWWADRAGGAGAAARR